MSELIVAALVLLASHFGISSTPLRDLLVARLGERPYLVLYSLIALAALAWLIAAWAQAPYVELWPVGPGLASLPFLVVPLALVLLVGGLSTPNPTAVGAADLLGQSDAVRGIFRITRHPFMWGVALWAGAHLLANGDLASVIFFASLAALALLGTLLIDRKYAARRGADWQRFAAAPRGVFTVDQQGTEQSERGQAGEEDHAGEIAVGEQVGAGPQRYAPHEGMAGDAEDAAHGLTLAQEIGRADRGRIGGAEPVRGIFRITRHPFMWGVALWAGAHLLANGDLASVIFFASLAALALLGTLLIDRKYAARRGADWQRFAAATSNLPFAALARGRQRLVWAEIGWRRVALALALYVLLLAVHPWLFGGAPLGAL